MLKYYYIKKYGKSHYRINDLLSNPTLYIVDTENKMMMNILDDIIQKEEESINELSFTDEESDDDVQLEKNEGNDIILENETYKQDNKLIKKIHKYYTILFLADYNESYIPLIKWLMNQNSREEKYPEKYTIKSIDFLAFQIQQKTIIKNNTEITNDYINISNEYYEYSEEDNYHTTLISFYETYQLKNDKYFQYFQTNINRYELYKESLECIPNHIEYLIINTASFTGPIGYLPNTLKYLKIKTGNFNKPIDNLPHNLEYLEIVSEDFNQEINFLPNNLKYLIIESAVFNQTLDYLPQNLEVLHIDSNSFNLTFINLPTNLKRLHVTIYLHSTNENNDIIDFNNLPNSLEYLYIRTNTPYSLEIIPTNLKEICVSNINKKMLFEKYPHLKEYDYYQLKNFMDF
jgi:hypothetical protein